MREKRWLSGKDEMLLESLQRLQIRLFVYLGFSVWFLWTIWEPSFSHFDLHADLAAHSKALSEMSHYSNSPHDGSICKEIQVSFSFWFHLSGQNSLDSIWCPFTLIFALHTLCKRQNMQIYIILCPCSLLTLFLLWFQRVLQYVYNRLNVEYYHMVFMTWPHSTVKSCSRLEEIKAFLEISVKILAKVEVCVFT